jgi:hypothetical protein
MNASSDRFDTQAYFARISVNIDAPALEPWAEDGGTRELDGAIRLKLTPIARHHVAEESSILELLCSTVAATSPGVTRGGER